jgi:regulator of protease activity HflC (stomatin/prohibitin superfamily)
MKRTQAIAWMTLVSMIMASTGCAIVRPNQVGVKQTLGRLHDDVKEPGAHFVTPLTTKVVRVQVATTNLAIQENLPSREGLTVQSESSILYSVRAADVPDLLRDTGRFYERDLILPVYRSAAADVCSRYDAKDMHSAKRGEIEQEIRKRMDELLSPKGILVESVLLKSIKLPQRIAESIERKLESEQEALRMGFVADQQRQEVQRKIIEEEGQREMATIRAEGQRQAALIQAEAAAQSVLIRAEAQAKATTIEAEAMQTYNEMLNRTLTSRLIELKRVEAFQAIGEGPNTKLLLHDGKSQLINVLGGTSLGN